MHDHIRSTPILFNPLSIAGESYHHCLFESAQLVHGDIDVVSNESDPVNVRRPWLLNDFLNCDSLNSFLPSSGKLGS